LAGRIDNAAHEASMAKVSQVIPYKEEIRSHLDQLLASSAFRGSRRCREFLSHVVEHALDGDFDGIKERTLGINVFGREASYDTNYDSIVRVTASEVRKRLLRYYKTSPASTFRIELRSGSYIPEFHCAFDESVCAPAATSEPGPIENSDAISEDPLDPVSISSDAISAITESGGDVPGQSGKIDQIPPASFIRPSFVLTACALCLIFLAIGWRAGTLHAKTALSRGPYSDAQYSFYKELLGPIATDPRQATKIVLSNPALFLYRGSASPTPAPDVDRGEKKIPIPQALGRLFDAGTDDAQGEFRYHYLAFDTTDYTGLGEAESAYNLERLFDALHRPVQLTEGRFLNWDEARDQHLVLLGSRHMSPWTQSNVLGANFKMDDTAIHNTRPKPGELSSYVQKFDGKVLVDYGLIWMSQAPSGSRILVLAGLTSTGTAGVGDFFVDPNQMRPVFEKLKAASPNGSIPGNWQVLVRITARDDVPLNVSFVDLRISQQ
jgi:hypothetical protein